ncbi:MAG: response regulator [Deltaproteobacteria bacterium]|nr:response regulator [Deltaproteobacteria bacterium]
MKKEDKTFKSEDKPRIMIVEDEVLIAADLALTLESLGFEICGKAASAEKTLQVIEKELPDIVMMDIALQGKMDGIEAAEVIRDQWSIPVVFLTACDDADRMKRARLAYPFGYLLKPVQERNIKITVEMALYVGKMDKARKQIKKRLQNERELLRLCHFATDERELIKGLTLYFKRILGCDAVGVRLQNGDDFPYYETRGFSEEFVLAENSLCALDSAGNIMRDFHGNAVLECMCGNIIRGRFDPSRSFFTKHGSFWSSCTSELLATTTEADRQTRTRNRCNAVGYESVALVPLRSQGKTLGLFQFNAMKMGLFTDELMAQLEHLVDYVALALVKQETQEHLQENLKIIKGFYETSPLMMGVAELDKDEIVIVHGNDSVAEFFGKTSDQLVGKTGRALYPTEEIADLWLGRYRRCQSEEMPLRFEHEHPLGQNKRYLSSTIKYIGEGPQGRPRFSFISEDITDQKREEEEKQKLQDQLFQAKKMESIGTLAGGVAHDFNNLLQAISGYTQLMLLDKTEMNPDYKKLKEILKAGERAGQLVRQLLLFSRKMSSEKKFIDLTQEIDQAVKLLERTIPKKIQIRCFFCNDLWPINADAVQIEQILLNLGSNAADAMPEGGLFIIETKNVTLDENSFTINLGALPGNYVLLTISDTGHGMNAETLEHLFEPFYTTKDIGKGTGLGLASVYGIVKNHGGYITCSSQLGRGTVFQIYFPVIDRTTILDTTWATLSPQGGNETVLLVDDEKFIKEFASQALRRFGYTMITAATGEEALRILNRREKKIDLILLDIGMPGMGGLRCMQEIFKIEPTMKISITTGYSFGEHATKALQQGAAGYMGKPYQLIDLLNKVRAVLDEDR